MKKGTEIGSWSSLIRAIVFIISLNLFGFWIASIILVLTFVPYKKLLKRILE